MRIEPYEFDLQKLENKFPREIWDSFIDNEFDFYGVDNNSFCIGSNGSRIVLEAVEDPDDGYRSYFGCFVTSEVDKIFFKSPIAKIVLKNYGVSLRSRMRECEDDSNVKDEKFVGWSLIDTKTGHTWLMVGTDYGDDYYPCFVFDYQPNMTHVSE